MAISIRRRFWVTLAIAGMFSPSSFVLAQSGTKSPPATNRTVQNGGSTSKQADVALSGYCPVCVLDMKKWVKGDPRFNVVQDGKTYLFPSDEQRQLFLKNPDK